MRKSFCCTISIQSETEWAALAHNEVEILCTVGIKRFKPTTASGINYKITKLVTCGVALVFLILYFNWLLERANVHFMNKYLALEINKNISYLAQSFLHSTSTCPWKM